MLILTGIIPLMIGAYMVICRSMLSKLKIDFESIFTMDHVSRHKVNISAIVERCSYRPNRWSPRVNLRYY